MRIEHSSSLIDYFTTALNLLFTQIRIVCKRNETELRRRRGGVRGPPAAAIPLDALVRRARGGHGRVESERRCRSLRAQVLAHEQRVARKQRPQLRRALSSSDSSCTPAYPYIEYCILCTGGGMPEPQYNILATSD